MKYYIGLDVHFFRREGKWRQSNCFLAMHLAYLKLWMSADVRGGKPIAAKLKSISAQCIKIKHC
jgi:hypothetical protein